MAFAGFLVDREIGTAPVLTVVLGVAGLVGTVLKVFYEFRARMDADSQARSGVGLP